VAKRKKLKICHPVSKERVFANIFMPQGDVLAPVRDIVGIIWRGRPGRRRVVAAAHGYIQGSQWRVPFAGVKPGRNYSLEIIDAHSKVKLAKVNGFHVVGVLPTIDINYPAGNGNFPHNGTAYGPGNAAHGEFYNDHTCGQQYGPNGSAVLPMPAGTWAYTFPGPPALQPAIGKTLRVTDTNNVNAQRDNINIT
jgi:hypothetical protein